MPPTDRKFWCEPLGRWAAQGKTSGGPEVSTRSGPWPTAQLLGSPNGQPKNNVLRRKTCRAVWPLMANSELFCSAHSLGRYLVPAVPEHEPSRPDHLSCTVQPAKGMVAARVIKAVIAGDEVPV
jgi:hypothetical protein